MLRTLVPASALVAPWHGVSPCGHGRCANRGAQNPPAAQEDGEQRQPWRAGAHTSAKLPRALGNSRPRKPHSITATACRAVMGQGGLTACPLRAGRHRRWRRRRQERDAPLAHRRGTRSRSRHWRSGARACCSTARRRSSRCRAGTAARGPGIVFVNAARTNARFRAAPHNARPVSGPTPCLLSRSQCLLPASRVEREGGAGGWACLDFMRREAVELHDTELRG